MEPRPVARAGVGRKGLQSSKLQGLRTRGGDAWQTDAGDIVSETWVLDLIPGTAFLDLEPRLKAVSHLVMEKPPSSTQREVG